MFFPDQNDPACYTVTADELRGHHRKVAVDIGALEKALADLPCSLAGQEEKWREYIKGAVTHYRRLVVYHEFCAAHVSDGSFRLTRGQIGSYHDVSISPFKAGTMAAALKATIDDFPKWFKSGGGTDEANVPIPLVE